MQIESVRNDQEQLYHRYGRYVFVPVDPFLADENRSLRMSMQLLTVAIQFITYSQLSMDQEH